MAAPLNSVAELVAFTNFSEGDPASVKTPTFRKSQFELALQMARDEIYDRTLGKENDDLGTRAPITKQAELYLATSRLYDMWGDRLGLLSKDANLVGIGSTSLGADTPPPLGSGSKMEFFVRYMSDTYRTRGINLLIGRPFSMGLGTDESTSRFPCLSRGYSDDANWICSEC